MGSTALRQFQRLETSGSWRPAPGEQLREVVVSIGEATLVLSDPKSGAPLAHWSLPAVQRTNPGKVPAIYAPAAADGDGRSEILEIDEPLMIDAIDRVQAAITSRQPHPGRLRGGLMMAALAAMIAVTVLWLPFALRSYAARIMPPAERIRVGEMILQDVTRATGQPCHTPAAEQVLQKLGQRIGLPDKARIRVIRDGVEGVLVLPGNLALVDYRLIEEQAGAEALAGHLLAAKTNAELNNPLRNVMQYTSFPDVLALLTRGAFPAHALYGYGETLLSHPPAYPSEQTLLARFGLAKIPITPYARTLPGRADAPPALTEADPFRTQPYSRILTERDWVVLQQVCIDER